MRLSADVARPDFKVPRRPAFASFWSSTISLADNGAAEGAVIGFVLSEDVAAPHELPRLREAFYSICSFGMDLNAQTCSIEPSGHSVSISRWSTSMSGKEPKARRCQPALGAEARRRRLTLLRSNHTQV